MLKKYKFPVIFATVFLSLFFSFFTKTNVAFAVNPVVIQNGQGTTGAPSYVVSLGGNLTTHGTSSSTTIVGVQIGTSTAYGGVPSFLYTIPMASTGGLNETTILQCGTYHYRWYAINGVTTYSSDATITAPYCFPVSHTGSATSVSSTSTTLNGNLTSMGNIASSTDVAFQYGPTTSYGSITSTTTVSNTSNFTKNITGLTACTTYHYRAIGFYPYSLNPAYIGSASLGSDSTFTTICPPVVTTGSSTSITYSSVTLGGNLTSIGTYSSSSVVGFNYGVTTSYGLTSATSSVSSTGTFTKNLSGLDSCTTYHYQAFAINGVATTGSDQTFKTVCPTPPTVTTGKIPYTKFVNGAVKMQPLYGSTSTSPQTINIYGDVTSMGGYTATSGLRLNAAVLTSSGTVVGYLGNASTATTVTTGIYTTVSSIFSLTCGSTYQAQAVIFNAAGVDIIATGTTVAFNACENVWSQYQSGVNLMGWLGYTNNLNTTYGFSGTFPGSPIVMGATTTGKLMYNTDLTGLVCGTTYSWQAYASNSSASSTGSTYNFTHTCTPPAVSTISAASAGWHTENLTGDLTTVGTASTSASVGFQYGLTTSYGATSTMSLSSGGTYTKTLGGLTLCATYHYRAYAINYHTATGTDATFTASCPTQPVVQTIGSSAITPTAATLTGNFKNAGTYAPTASVIGFQYGLTTSYGSTINSTGTFSTGNYSLTINTGLFCGTTYHYRAFVTDGIDGYGSDKTFTTAACTGTNGNVTGYAFGNDSGNLQWISLNCAQGLVGTSTQTNTCGSSQYSVNVTPNFTTNIGTFSGYAWAPGSGWITFNSSQTSSCGSAATVNLSSGTASSGFVSGYAKLLTPISGTGCISLRGTVPASSTTYGVLYVATSTANNLAGSASNVSKAYITTATSSGLINFTYANLNLGTSTLQLAVNGATSTALTSAGGTVSLVWNATNMKPSNCTATSSDNSWTGGVSSGGGSQLITFGPNTGTSTLTKTFTISGCVGINGSTFPSRSVSVTIYPNTSSTIIFKANGAGDTTPLNVTTGDAVTLTWQLQNINHGACSGTSTTASGPLSGWSGTTKSPTSLEPSVGGTPVTYSEIIIATSSRTYTLSCTGSSTITKSVNIITNDPVVPASVSLTVDGGSTASMPPSGGGVTLQWITSNLDVNSNCTATSTDGLWSGSKSNSGGADLITIPSSTTTLRTYKLYGCKGNGVTIPPITVTVKADNLTFLGNGQSTVHIVPGQSVTLSWEQQSITHGSCSGTSSGNYTGWSSNSKYPLITDPSVGTTTVTTYEVVGADGSITSNRSYTLTCSGASTYTKTVNIITDLACVGTACDNGHSTSNVNLKVNGGATESLSSAGGVVNLVWTTSNLASTGCTATSSDGLWTGAKSSSGGNDAITVPSNTGSSTITHTYTLSGCTNVITGISVPSQSVTVAVVGSGVPAIVSFTANGVDSSSSLTMTAGTMLTLSWTVQNVSANACVGTSSGTFNGWKGTVKLPSSSVTTAQTFTDYIGANGSVTTSRTYTLTCSGTASPKTVTINIVPPVVDTQCTGTSCGSDITPNLKATKRPPWMEI